MLPLSMLNATKKQPIMVEVKTGENYNGTLVSCDAWMNLHLTNVIQTSSDGNRFWKLSETFIRGSAVKYVRLPEEIMDDAREINKKQQQQRRTQAGGPRGGPRGGARGSFRGNGRAYGEGVRRPQPGAPRNKNVTKDNR